MKYLTVGALLFYLGAMFAAMRAVQPRSYQLYRHNLTCMREGLRPSQPSSHGCAA